MTTITLNINEKTEKGKALLAFLKAFYEEKEVVHIVEEPKSPYNKEFVAKIEKAKKENWNLVAMLNNDMIGNSNSSETNITDNTRVRIFSEGVPAAETEQMAAIRRYTNGENDSKSRQLARYMKEVGERYVDQLEVKLVYRNDRFLRGGDHTPFAREETLTLLLVTFPFEIN